MSRARHYFGAIIWRKGNPVGLSESFQSTHITVAIKTMTRATRFDNRELLDLLLQEEGIERSPTLEIRPDRAAPPCLSRAQCRLWTLYQAAPDIPAYNISEAVRMTGQLDVAALEASLNEIVRRHESLRSCFPGDNGRPTVLVRDALALGIPLDDLSHLPEHEQKEE